MSGCTHMATAEIYEYELILEYCSGTMQSIPAATASEAIDQWVAARQMFNIRSATLVSTRREVPYGSRS